VRLISVLLIYLLSHSPSGRLPLCSTRPRYVLNHRASPPQIQISQGSASTYFSWSGHFCIVSLSVSSKKCLPIFIEIGSYLTNIQQKISWHVFFLRQRCERIIETIVFLRWIKFYCNLLYSHDPRDPICNCFVATQYTRIIDDILFVKSWTQLCHFVTYLRDGPRSSRTLSELLEQVDLPTSQRH